MSNNAKEARENIAHRARWAAVARDCIATMDASNMKGQAREKAAVAYMLGANSAMKATGIITVDSPVAWLCGIRGYREILEIAKLDEQDKPAASAAA